MMDDVNKNPEDEAENNEVESPVDGPTPDWMRLATSAGGSGSSLTEENTPAWLKSIRAGQGSAPGKKQPEPPQPAAIQPAASTDEGMSDLERLLAEEGIDLGSVAEERPEGSGDMSARDWLISTSSEEIIRNKLGAQPQAEEPASPPVPPSAPGQASDDGLSDWERLLAEEGIDLGSVAEERPEGSGGMSARDWLIATSSEEIIRNKLAAQPQPEPEPAPTPSITSFGDDKMVVESDLPDWLQEIADDVAEAEATEAAWPISEPEPPLPSPIAVKEDDMLVVAEELPDWLQEVAEDSAAAPITSDEEISLPPAVSTFVAAEDKMVVEEDLPDWLRDISDEKTEVPATSPEPIPANIETPAPLPETVSPPFAEDKMVVEADLPDWLQEMAEAEIPTAVPPTAEASPTSIPSDNLVIEEELPDWLQNMAEEPDLTAELETQPEPSFTAPPLPSSLAEDKMIVTDDLPDWLREVADEQPKPLQEPETAAPIPPSPSADKMVVDEDLPDWLREVETGSMEDVTLTQTGFEAVTPEPDELESDEDLPDWLREVEVSHLEDNLTLPPPKPIADLSTEEPAFTASSLSDDELDALDADDLPSWLKEVQERDGREAADSVSKPLITELSLPLDSAGEVIEDELPGWLRDVPEETTPLEFEALEPPAEPLDQMVIEEDLPDWLREEEFNLDDAFEPSEPSPEILPERGISDLPDWLQEIQDEAPEEAVAFEDETPQPVTAPSASLAADAMVEEAGLPDWLREVEAEEEVELPAFEAPVATPVPVPGIVAEATTTEVVDEEGLPDWLREVEAEEEEVELPAFEAPVATPVPVPGIVAETTTTEVVDEEGLPDWLRADEAAEEVELPAFETPVTAPVLEIVTEVITTEMVIAEVVEEEAEPVAAAQPVEEVVEPETPAPAPIFEPEPVSQPLEAAPSEGGIPDWLQKLREVDEESPVSIPAMPLPAPVQVTAPVRQAPRPVYAQAVTASPDIPADAAEQLQLARTSRDKGNLDEAVRIYDSLVSRGIYLDKIIEDMQQSIKAQPKNYLLFQVMGDAMMRDGRLQSALNAYREALARL